MAYESKTESKKPEPTPPQKESVKPFKHAIWMYSAADQTQGILCNTEAEYLEAVKAGCKDTILPEAWK